MNKQAIRIKKIMARNLPELVSRELILYGERRAYKRLQASLGRDLEELFKVKTT